MRELVADMFITLDGYALGEGAPAYFGYHGMDLQHWIDEQPATPEVLLMGRVTYELFSSVGQEGQDDSSMTGVSKLVFSNTLQEPLSWKNSRLIRGALADEIRTLKDQEGNRLRTIGSLSIVKNLLRAGLVDRLRLMVFPLVLGATGREPLFTELPDIELELSSSTILDARLLMLEYRPKAPAKAVVE